MWCLFVHVGHELAEAHWRILCWLYIANSQLVVTSSIAPIGVDSPPVFFTHHTEKQPSHRMLIGFLG